MSAEPKKEAGPANRLAKESSPYLLQHAHNPVDWYPWGPEAFAKAKKEGKLIFLSIGYSSCHWCHVMEKESFQDKDVAKILNDHFVCIKVDREERPDVDDIYMTALQVMDGRGGWPLSMFLTDDGKPIVGGTYFPKEDRKVGDQTARGFKSILKYMHEVSKEKNKELRDQASSIADATREALTRAGRITSLVSLNRELAKGAADDLKEAVDPKHGGIGNSRRRFEGTKFPMPPSLSALLHAGRRDKDEAVAGLVTMTLTKMAEGGIYDQLGGGFHRYSTERTWTVPHFEKMLYDNAQLVELYAEAYRIDPRPIYARVVDETFQFLRREMTAPQGGFYSALDADSEGKEGEFYIWTPDQIDKALNDSSDAALIKAVYSVSGSPNFEERAFVLKITRPLAEIAKEQKLSEADLAKRLDHLKVKLRAAREQRPRPFLDTKVLTAWNGQMIAGLALAGQVFRKPEYTKAAVAAAEFVLATLRTKEGRLLRTYSLKADGKGEAKLNAYLEDYAYFAHGLLALHDATNDARWLTEARAISDTMIRWHGDKDAGGYFTTSSDHEELFARPKDHHDGVQPSGNSVAARNLVRLWQKTKDDKYKTEAERTIKQFTGVMKSNASSMPAMAEALHLFLDFNGQAVQLQPAGKPAEGGVRKTEDAVKGEAKIGPADKNGKRTVTVTLRIAKEWHIYANPVDNDDLQMAMTTIELYANGKKVTASVKYPPGKKTTDEKGTSYLIYEGEAAIPVTVDAAAADGLEVRARVQACTKDKCLLPARLTIPVK